LAEFLAHRTGDEARDDVRCAAGGVRDDDTDGTLRILLRLCASSSERCGRDGCQAGQKSASIYTDHDFVSRFLVGRQARY
jgi:hypothetical protein